MTAPTMARRAASIAPSTYNADARTIDAVLTTGASVRRRDWNEDFIEVLDLSGADLSRVDAGAVHLLDAHNSYEAAAILGAVTAARLEAGGIVGTIALAGREEVAGIVEDIAAGAIRALSIGYSVEEWRDGGKDATTGLPVRTAARWTLLEASVVPVPADAGAGFRVHPSADPMAAARRLEANNSPLTSAAVAEIARAARVPLTNEDFNTMTTITPAAARAAILDRAAAVADATPTRTHHTAGTTGSRDLSDRIIQAVRAGITPDDLRRDAAAVFGQRSGSAMLTVSDFSAGITAAAGTLIVEHHNAVRPALLSAARSMVAGDLVHPAVLARLDGPARFEKVNEGGEVKTGVVTVDEGGVKVATYSRLLTLSRQLLSLGEFGAALSDPLSILARGAAETQAGLLHSALSSTANLRDGTPAFHATRGNLLTLALDLTNLGAAIAALRLLPGPSGTALGLQPRYLVVGPTKELAARQLVAQVQPSDRAQVQPWPLEVLVDHLEPGAGWFVLPDPVMEPVLGIARFDATGDAPRIETRDAWPRFGLEMRGTLDVGVGLVGWRGVKSVPGS